MKLIRRWIKRLFFISFIFIGLALIGVLYYIEFELPNIDALNTVQLQVPLQIFTADGKLIAEYGEKRRIPIPYDEIPQPLIQAVLATEDQRYFQHPGIDIPGLLRACVALIATGKKEQGGSTITMQVARSFYLSRHKTFGRKLREILLALKIDHKLSKQKILELYLNKIFLGNRAYGVEAAAQIYYGKRLSELSLDQYAMLAGLPKAPSALNPLANAEAALKRRNHVLRRMFEQGYIDENAFEIATKAPLNARYHAPLTELKAPYAAELARHQLEQMYGDSIYTEGFNVYTTIDSKTQEAANKAVRDGLLAYDGRHGYRGPEDNWGAPDLNNLEVWEAKLNNIPLVNQLEPAVVIDMSEKTVTVLRANGSITIIPWEGLSWARKQINEDYLGRFPNEAADILKLGDLVRITLETHQSFRLAQIPMAEAGLVALNPKNGAIIALTGGFDFKHSNFNRITNAQRQPGSSFKPFIYSAALEKGITLSTIINDAPIVIVNPNDNSLWRPQNVEHKFYGPTRLRNALIHSRNLVSIRLLGLIKIPYAVRYAERFGFSPLQLPPALSLALGTANVTPLQMAAAYSIFANGGFRTTPFILKEIRSSHNEILYQAKPLTICNDCSTPEKDQPADNTLAPRVISAENAFLITSVLHDVIQHGTGILAKNLNRNDLAGKTGTTNNQHDAWFVGYNPNVVALAWLGFDQPQSLHEYGAQAALPMWVNFMKIALEGQPDQPLNQPPGIVSIKINPLTGQRAFNNDPQARFEYFMAPYLPTETVARAPDQTWDEDDEGAQRESELY